MDAGEAGTLLAALQEQAAEQQQALQGVAAALLADENNGELLLVRYVCVCVCLRCVRCVNMYVCVCELMSGCESCYTGKPTTTKNSRLAGAAAAAPCHCRGGRVCAPAAAGDAARRWRGQQEPGRQRRQP